MLKPSDFNNAVPQFSNGNYASNPINPQYVEEPSSTDYNRGTEPLQTLPAQWWNWFMNKFTSRFNKVNIYVKNLFNELAQLLSLVNVTPDGTESTVTDGQLKNAFKELYPNYINTKLALESTYVKKTQKVNGHALSGDVTVSKSDVGLGNVPNVSTNDQTPTYTKASTLTALSSGEKVSIAFGKLAKAVSSLISHIGNTSNPHSVTKAQVGLGNVVNTGDSATPVENGTTKFTTGGAYTLKKDLTDIAESLPTDAVFHYSFDDVPDYPDGTAVARNFNGDTYDVYVSSTGTISFDAYAEDGKIHKSNINGNANYKTNVGSNRSLGIYFGITSETGLIKIIEFVAKTPNLDVHIFYRQNQEDKRTVIYPLGNSISVGKHRLVTFIPQNCFEYSIVFYSYASDLNYTEWELTGYYLGDGSYSTPIIDNANGQWNSVSQSGIAVQGVSGKAIQCFNGNGVNIGNFNFNTDFTISLWVNPNDVANELKTIMLKENVFAFYNGTQSDNVIQYILIQNGTAVRQNFSTRLPANKYTHLVLSKSGTTIKAYIDGTLANTKTLTTNVVDQNSNNLYLGRTDSFGSVKSKFDDLLIFDRALSDTEVQALYQNKANTPKYYDINNYILDNTDSTPTQNSTDLVTSGGVYTELAKKVDKTTTVNGHALSGDVTVSKSDVGLGNVPNVSTNDQTPTYTKASTLTALSSGEKVSIAFGKLAKAVSSLISHIGNTSNPHSVTKAQVGLGNVVNTGDSATPVSGGTTKFTTGGAYNLLTSLAPIFSTSTTYAVGDMVTYNGVLYTCTTAHSAGAWNASHFTVSNLNTEFQKPANNIAVNFTTGKRYSKGELVIYNKELYRCKYNTFTSVDAWDSSLFEKTGLLNNEQKYPGLYVLNVNANVSTVVALPELPAGSELIIRMDNQSSSNRTVTLKATKKYVLGILSGLTSAVRTLQVNETYALKVNSGGYIEMRINYIKVDDGVPEFLNDSLLSFPLPTVNDYYV